ncbi:hypothetical protein B0H17DRAFT_1090386 [Mycena rosella]|uniref:Uncharacterized protein n=1 Tax=Mycena rosella TaxID=1033263 RepID=A0AAD7CVC4_MYCRO|nr:hypothetical protein B0H17DRAFT_1090386 [Mycena rosella]
MVLTCIYSARGRVVVLSQSPRRLRTWDSDNGKSFPFQTFFVAAMPNFFFLAVPSSSLISPAWSEGVVERTSRRSSSRIASSPSVKNLNCGSSRTHPRTFVLSNAVVTGIHDPTTRGPRPPHSAVAPEGVDGGAQDTPDNCAGLRGCWSRGPSIRSYSRLPPILFLGVSPTLFLFAIRKRLERTLRSADQSLWELSATRSCRSFFPLPQLALVPMSGGPAVPLGIIGLHELGQDGQREEPSCVLEQVEAEEEQEQEQEEYSRADPVAPALGVFVLDGAHRDVRRRGPVRPRRPGGREVCDEVRFSLRRCAGRCGLDRVDQGVGGERDDLEELKPVQRTITVAVHHPTPPVFLQERSHWRPR